MVNGGRVSNWTCINFARNVQESVARGFCYELAQMCQISGMNLARYCYIKFQQEFAREPVLPPLSARPDQVERALKARYHDAMSILQPQGKELDLLIVILPDNNGMSKQYLANVALKINVKVVASQDWPEVTKYAGLVCAQAHRQELIQDLFKVWQDPQRGTVTGGMIKYDSLIYSQLSIEN
ncbi:hypothetical protein BHE74_00023827 [Ensete ventricosum]|nr:hypothetical protein BHE74_00023827 [Ensete ventricosum]